MKKVFLLFLVLIGTQQALTAQVCLPAEDLPDSVIVSPLPYTEENPLNGIQDTACANTPYETVLTFKIPSTIEIQGNEFPLNSVDVAPEGAVMNLPEGFDYACNPPNCVFEADSLGCIVVFGEADPTAVGMYDLTIDVVIRSLIDFPTTLPDGSLVQGNYFLFVREEGGENCTTVGVIDNPLTREVSLTNRPNPFKGQTDIVINSQISGNFSFTVRDLLGANLHQERVNLVVGENIFTFDGSHLPEGMYLYSISDNNYAATGKMILQR